MELALCDNLTGHDWDRMRSRVLNEVAPAQSLPGSLVAMLERDLTTLRQADANGDDSSLVCELTPVTEDYLDFLRQQIALNARGEGWTAILSDRLNRLVPYAGRSLLRVTLRSPDGLLTVRLRPADFGVVHWELD